MKGAALTWDDTPADRSDYLEVLCRGGYPEVQAMKERSRRRWFSAYLRPCSTVRSKISRTFETDMRWFLVHRVPGWGRGLASKVVLRPKVYMVDTGLAAALIGKDVSVLMRPTEPATGPLLETLVAGELLRQMSWSDTDAHLFHFREREGREADLVVEAVDGRVIGLEIKATTTARIEDFKGLTPFERPSRSSRRFHCCRHRPVRWVEASSLWDRLAAVPVSDLWR